jgi:hypothetical protein
LDTYFLNDLRQKLNGEALTADETGQAKLGLLGKLAICLTFLPGTNEKLAG